MSRILAPERRAEFEHLRRQAEAFSWHREVVRDLHEKLDWILTEE